MKSRVRADKVAQPVLLPEFKNAITASFIQKIEEIPVECAQAAMLHAIKMGKPDIFLHLQKKYRIMPQWNNHLFFLTAIYHGNAVISDILLQDRTIPEKVLEKATYMAVRGNQIESLEKLQAYYIENESFDFSQIVANEKTWRLGEKILERSKDYTMLSYLSNKGNNPLQRNWTEIIKLVKDNKQDKFTYYLEHGLYRVSDLARHEVLSHLLVRDLQNGYDFAKIMVDFAMQDLKANLPHLKIMYKQINYDYSSAPSIYKKIEPMREYLRLSVNYLLLQNKLAKHEDAGKPRKAKI